jgi:outer membrane protein OmpA-like peptidoglycan-associated protein
MTLALLLALGGARAQDVFSVDVARFRPAIDARGYGVTESASTLGHLEIGVGLWGNHEENSVVLVYEGRRVLGGARYEDAILRRRSTADLQLAVGMFDRVSLGFSAPVVLWQKGLALEHLADRSVGDDLVGAGLSDVRGQLKITALEPGVDPLGLAFLVNASIPTGETVSLLGEGGLTVTPMVVLEVADGSLREKEYAFRAAINAGYRFRRAATFRDLTIGDEVVFAGAIGVRPIPWTEFGFEVHGAYGGPGPAHNPLELAPLVLLHPSRDITLTAGGSIGLLPGLGTPDYRVFVGGTISPSFDPRVRDRDGDGIVDKHDRCPNVPEDFDGFEDDDGCPDYDNDGDGILDRDDACPDDPEDFDGFEDEDGCPDYDNDGDGILDVDDACPNDPETFNGFEDEDGCPDAIGDRDGDGYLDHLDLCPDQPEDFDGFEDEDGCPDVDNDGDGILDVFDKCPNEPETFNGFEDEDGCPDEAPRRVQVERARIIIIEQIFFDLDRATIKAESYALLDELVRTFEEHPDILRVRVEGHTDSTGPVRYNERLSQARAESVVAALVARGVAPERMEAVGYGPHRPIASNSSPDGMALNRRVEFNILERD